jgi:hypothetical protein
MKVRDIYGILVKLKKKTNISKRYGTRTKQLQKNVVGENDG